MNQKCETCVSLAKKLRRMKKQLRLAQGLLDQKQSKHPQAVMKLAQEIIPNLLSRTHSKQEAVCTKLAELLATHGEPLVVTTAKEMELWCLDNKKEPGLLRLTNFLKKRKEWNARKPTTDSLEEYERRRTQDRLAIYGADRDGD